MHGLPASRRRARQAHRIGQVLASSVACAWALGTPRPVRAEEPPVEAADGTPACAKFEEKNARELAEWEKDQPKSPYRYPRERLVLGAPWTPLLSGFGSTVGLVAATVIPHVGAQLRKDEPAAFVAWPWQLPIGAPSTCERTRGSFAVKVHRTHRLMLEPGFVSSNRGLGVFTRPGYRFLLHPSDWVVGVGGGLGSTFEIAGNREPFRFSVSPEVLAHFGHCCEPGYFTLSFRYDHFFGGEIRDVLGGSLGFTYF